MMGRSRPSGPAVAPSCFGDVTVRVAARAEARTQARTGEAESETDPRFPAIRSRGRGARRPAVIDDEDDPAPGFACLTPHEALSLLRPGLDGQVRARVGEGGCELSRDAAARALRRAHAITLAPRHSSDGSMNHWVRAHMADGTTIALASDHPED